MSNYAKHMTSNQSEKARHDQVQNSAGGYTFALDQWKRLERFLILGSDSNTYYASARTLTRQNAAVVEQCWLDDPAATSQYIANISAHGRAAKNDAAIFALALGAVSTSEKARQLAYHVMPTVCRTATHLFMFISFCEQLGKGWGRGMKRAVANWYDSKTPEQVAYQAIKYRSREGYDHNRVLDLCHTQNNDNGLVYQWITGHFENKSAAPEIIHLFEAAQAGTLAIEEYPRLPWEAFPTEKLNDPALWSAILPNMGLTALIRNLGKMTSIGVIAPLSKNLQIVIAKLGDKEEIKRSRVHPLNILTAMKTYAQGRGTLGSLSWEPNQLIVRALNDAFYLAFQNVAPTGENYLLALDVSSSMTGYNIMNSAVNAREGAAAMALVTATMEQNVHIVGFARATASGYTRGTNIVPVPISAGQRLDDAVKAMADVPFGGTDCAAPVRYALDNNLEVDKIVIYTDNETYGDGKHAFQLVQEYRRKTGRNLKMIVVGMVSNGFTIADPNDAGMLDVVGFDTATPALISSF